MHQYEVFHEITINLTILMLILAIRLFFSYPFFLLLQVSKGESQLQFQFPFHLEMKHKIGVKFIKKLIHETDNLNSTDTNSACTDKKLQMHKLEISMHHLGKGPDKLPSLWMSQKNKLIQMQ